MAISNLKSSLIYKGLPLLFGIFLILLLFSCLVGFWKTCVRDYSPQRLITDEKLIDLLSKSDMINEYDSINQKRLLTRVDLDNIIQTQKTIILRQQILIDDVRQEANNLINKMNGWLALWIGILALLGVILPIILQIKYHNDTKEAQEKQSQELERNKEELYKDVRCKITDINVKQAELDQAWKNKKEEINRKVEDIEKNFTAKLFLVNINKFEHIYDLPSLFTIEERKILLRQVWNEIILNFGQLIKDFCNNPTVLDKKASSNTISMALVLIIYLFTLIKKLSPYRLRVIDKLDMKGKKLISILNDPTTDNTDIREKLSSYFDSLRSVSI